MRNVSIAVAPLLLCLASSALAAQSPAWRLSEAAGDVQVIVNGRSSPALRDTLVMEGALITTGAEARAVIVRGKQFVVISPGSRLRVPATPESSTGMLQLIVEFGTSLFKVDKKSVPYFSVKTPYLAAVVKGTTFSVTAGAGGGSVQVMEGAVEVSTLDGGAAETIRPGSVATVGASDLFELTIRGDASKVIRSKAGADADGTVVVPIPGAKPAASSAPVLSMAPMQLLLAEEASILPAIAAGASLADSPAEIVLRDLGERLVDVLPPPSPSRDSSRPASLAQEVASVSSDTIPIRAEPAPEVGAGADPAAMPGEEPGAHGREPGGKPGKEYDGYRDPGGDDAKGKPGRDGAGAEPSDGKDDRENARDGKGAGGDPRRGDREDGKGRPEIGGDGKPDGRQPDRGQEPGRPDDRAEHNDRDGGGDRGNDKDDRHRDHDDDRDDNDDRPDDKDDRHRHHGADRDDNDDRDDDDRDD